MSRRSFPQCLAAGLLAAAVSPALAQPPSPWRVGVDVAPAPRPVAKWGVPVGHEIRVAVPPLGSSAAAKPAHPPHEFELFIESSAGGPRARDPMVLRPTVLPQAQPSSCCPPPAVAIFAAAPDKLNGTFYREMPGLVAALTFRGNEAKLVATVNTDDATVTVTLTAHCAVTTDGTVHGVITGADVDVGSNATAGMELAGVCLEMQQYVDQPFAFRARPSDGGLMVAGLKVAGPALDPQMLAAFAGKFKPAVGGVVPVAKAMKGTCVPVGRCDSAPNPTYIQLNAGSSPYMPTPGVRVAPCPTAPAGAPADVGDAMVRTFQQMFGGMTLPSPQYLQHTPQYVPLDPAFPLPRELRSQEPPDGVARRGVPSSAGCAVPCPTPVPCQPVPFQGYASPAPVQPSASPAPVLPAGYVPLPTVTPLRPAGAAPTGTWYREVGAVLYTVVVKDNHVTITSKMAMEQDGKTLTQGVVLTGDYHVTRDGSNLVGLVTGVDAVIEGALPENTQPDEIAKIVTKLQKAMTDKPFALSFRVYDNALVLGNVRLPACEDEELGAAMEAMGGRYATAGDKPLPKPKPVKLGSVSSDKPSPPKSSGRVPTQQYSVEPNVRMQQLLDQSEDLRQIKNEWRRFWFNDQPSHLTPERIHGGIN